MNFQDNENNIQELMAIFQTESEEILERIFENFSELEKTPENKEVAATLYRDLHSLKGAVRMVGFNNIQTIIHKIEDIMDKVNTENRMLTAENFTIINKALSIISKYLQ